MLWSVALYWCELQNKKIKKQNLTLMVKEWLVPITKLSMYKAQLGGKLIKVVDRLMVPNNTLKSLFLRIEMVGRQ